MSHIHVKIKAEWEELTGKPFDELVAELYTSLDSIEAVADKMEISGDMVRRSLSRSGIPYGKKLATPRKRSGPRTTPNQHHYAPDGALVVDWLRKHNVTSICAISVIRRLKAGWEFHDAVYRVSQQQRGAKNRARKVAA